MTKKQLYRSFCRHCYLDCGGWIPMMPLTRKLGLGDFGQIQRTGLVILGNISKLRLVNDIASTDAIGLHSECWQFETGVEKIFDSIQIQADDLNNLNSWSKQVLSFAKKGDFVFHGAEAKARFIANWSEFKQDITLKLTQSDYSFRDVYVITAVADVDRWGLAIAGADGAELELAAQTGEADHFAMLSHQSAIAQQSRHIATFEKSAGRTGYFFKAKKLVLSDQKKEQLIRQMLHPKVPSDAGHWLNWLNADLLNRVQLNELNAANCLDFFDWVDVSLDDVEKLC